MSLHYIKQLIHRKRIGNACTFGRNTTIDSKAYFEGMNRLGENTWFLNSSIPVIPGLVDIRLLW